MKDKRIEAYEWWRTAVFGPQPFRAKIPHKVLRDYLGVMQLIRRNRKGLHNVTVTVSSDSNIGLLDTNRIMDSDITIRVKGQKYDA